MNIFLVYPVGNSLFQGIKKYFPAGTFFEIIIEDFERIWSDYAAEIPLITGNEMVNILLAQVNEQWGNNYPNADLILIERSLDVFQFGITLQQWKKCDVFIINNTRCGTENQV